MYLSQFLHPLTDCSCGEKSPATFFGALHAHALWAMVALIVLSSTASAQNFKFLEVKVLDENGKPMPDVPVEIKMDGLNFPMPTDPLGMVSLNVSASNNPVELRVRHEGYASQRQRWRRGIDVPAEFSFRMQVGQPIKGTVLGPNNQPITRAEIYTAPPDESLTFHNGKNPPKSKQASVATDPNGEFTLPFLPIGTTIACLSDAGWAKIAKHEEQEGKPLTIRLTPWARVQLTTNAYQDTPSNERLGLQFVSAQEKDQGKVNWTYELRADEQGRAVFDRVIPGSAMAYRWVSTRGTRSIPKKKYRSHGVIATFRQGQSSDVVLGESKYNATGKLFKPVAYRGKANWSGGYVALTENNAVDLVLRTAIFEYGKLLSQSNVYRPEQRVPPSGVPNYLVRYIAPIEPDGSYTIDAVPPGPYKLSAVVPATPGDSPQSKDQLKLNELPITLTATDNGVTLDAGEHILSD